MIVIVFVAGWLATLLLINLLETVVQKLDELLAVELEVKDLVEKLKGQVVDPAKIDSVLAQAKANRDALAALVTPPAPTP